MAVRSRQESRTEQTSNHRAAWRGLLNSDLYDSVYIIYGLIFWNL